MKTRLALLIGILLGSTPWANASVDATVTANPGGTYTYEYTVRNPLGAPDDIWAWSLGLNVMDWDPLDVFAGGDVEVPASTLFWIAQAGVPVGTAYAQDFVSLLPAEDILRGTDLGVFSFTSAFPPDTVPVTLFGPTGAAWLENTVGPTAIPESGAAGVVIGAAVVGLAGWKIRRTRILQQTR